MNEQSVTLAKEYDEISDGQKLHDLAVAYASWRLSDFSVPKQNDEYDEHSTKLGDADTFLIGEYKHFIENFIDRDDCLSVLEVAQPKKRI